MEEENIVSVFDTENVDSILDELNGTNTQNEHEEQEHEMQTYTNGIHLDEESSENDSEQDAYSEFVERMERDFNITNDENRENESRFSGAEWFENVKNLDILIAGIGGIGSWASFLISRLHPCEITMFDDDTIELSNLSGQLFNKYEIGQAKVIAMKQKILRYSDYYCSNVYNERYEGQRMSDIMICGFDNMKSRKTFFNKWKSLVNNYQSEEERRKMLFIDGRLGLEELQIFSIVGNEEELMEKYEKEFLFDDSEAEQIPCSMKQTSFMASMIGSIMTNILVNFATNMNEQMDVRPVPFITLYNASDMRLQTKFQ